MYQRNVFMKMDHFTRRPALVLLCGIALGWTLTTLLSSDVFGLRGATHLLRRSASAGAFVLCVTVKFTSDDDKVYFREIFKPLAEFVALEELGTLSYELLESDKDSKQMLVLERYRDKEAYLVNHRTSPIFLEFRRKMGILVDKGVISIDGHSYIESNIGFV